MNFDIIVWVIPEMQWIDWKTINKNTKQSCGVWSWSSFSIGLKSFGMRRYKEDRNHFCAGCRSSGL